MTKGATRILTGSIGAAESRFEFEYQFESLAELEKAWASMAKNPGHAKSAADLESHIVSRTNRWEILRVVE